MRARDAHTARLTLLGAALVSALALAPSFAAAEPGSWAYRGSASSPESLSTQAVAGVVRSLEVRLRPLSGTAGSAGLVLHHQDASNHYLFLFSTNSTALMLYRKLGGAYTLLDSVPFSSPLGEEHVLGAEDDGAGGLTLTWDGAPMVSVTDTTFDSGGVGVRVWNMVADFDDVHARDGGGATLLFDDFEDGNADGWNAGNGWQVVGGGGALMPIPSFDTSYEGGNGEVTLVDPASWSIYVRPELKGSSPYRAWFDLGMSGLSSAQPTTIHFQSVSFFTGGWYSYDRVTWKRLPGSSSSATLTFEEPQVWIAHSIPYGRAERDRLIADVAGPLVRTSTLATSEAGYRVPVLRITAPGSREGRCGVWLVARNHAWEASGSWVADGLVRWLVSGEPEAMDLLQRAEIHVVPLLDVDNVVLGGSGKDQSPIDMNRDWRTGPYWNAVGASITAIEAFAAAGSYDLFIDSHCPGSSTTFLAVQPQANVSPDYWARFLEFRQRLNANTPAYGGSYTEWGPGYHPLWYQMSFWHQYDQHPGLHLSLTLETAVGTLASYASLARGMGLTIRERLPCERARPRRWGPSQPASPATRTLR